MNVFVVMYFDRHVDPEPIVFASRAAAIERAREIVQEYVDEGRAIEVEQQQPGPGDWLYYGTWNNEGDDYIFVVERSVGA